MANSNTEIGNLALLHLGQAKKISNLDTERSPEGLVLRTFYDTARKEVLRDFPWPFATKIDDLVLIESDPNDDWGYSYQYPTDCLEFRRILSGVRTDNRQSRVPYRIGQSDDALLVFSDELDAQGEWTMDVENTTLYPNDFTMAFSFLLASYSAPAITAGDPFKMGEAALKKYQFWISKAQLNAKNEEQPDEEPDSEFIRTRS